MARRSTVDHSVIVAGRGAGAPLISNRSGNSSREGPAPKPRNEYRARRSPPSTLSSRNRGSKSLSLSQAETGVSRSAAMSNGGCISKSCPLKKKTHLRHVEMGLPVCNGRLGRITRALPSPQASSPPALYPRKSRRRSVHGARVCAVRREGSRVAGYLALGIADVRRTLEEMRDALQDHRS